jgi:hypothetical protein
MFDDILLRRQNAVIFQVKTAEGDSRSMIVGADDLQQLAEKEWFLDFLQVAGFADVDPQVQTSIDDFKTEDSPQENQEAEKVEQRAQPVQSSQQQYAPQSPMIPRHHTSQIPVHLTVSVEQMTNEIWAQFNPQQQREWMEANRAALQQMQQQQK